MSRSEPFSLYLHIPYCARKCPYCDFNVHVARKIPEAEYTEALIRELNCHAESEAWRCRSLGTIFFGGGTPSLFAPSGIARILEVAAALFGFEPGIEISLEANPDPRNAEHFLGYRGCGVNRLSLGVQSFQSHLLEALGRLHSAADSRNALRMVAVAGFEDFNLDLIFACPGQSLDDVRADLDETLSFAPPHVSAYNLAIEEKTVFHRLYRQGKIASLPEETEVAMAGLVEEALGSAGLKRYEISNFASPGRESRHNVNYWRGGDYLGVGAGAHSYRRLGPSAGLRWHNEKHPGRYMARVAAAGQAVAEEETIDRRRSAAEFMFLGLRMAEGVSVKEFARRFGEGPREFYPAIVDWLEGGLLEEGAERLRLSRRGLLVSDSIFERLV